MRIEPNTDHEHYLEYIEELMEIEREKILFAMSEIMGHTNSTQKQRDDIAEALLEGDLVYDLDEDGDQYPDSERVYKLLNRDLQWFKDQFEDKRLYDGL